jgi:hypothetical protein
MHFFSAVDMFGFAVKKAKQPRIFKCQQFCSWVFTGICLELVAQGDIIVEWNMIIGVRHRHGSVVTFLRCLGGRIGKSVSSHGTRERASILFDSFEVILSL